MRKDYLWLQMFATDPWTGAGTSEINPVNVTTQESMAVTMKTYYSKYLLQNVRENIIFTQFAKKEPIHGNTVEWRKFNTFPKLLTPIDEAVIPEGKLLGMTNKTASTMQYGGYAVISDRLQLESFDPVLQGAVEEIGASKVATYDTLTRNIIVAGTSVLYAPIVSGGTETPISHRYEITADSRLTSTVVNRAATWLQKNKAPKINGDYVGIIHPSQAYDLRESKGWLDAHEYAQPNEIYNGEIGKLHGVRFIVATETKVYKGAPLTEGSPTLTVASAVTASTSVSVAEEITADDATALAGRKITVAGATSTELTIASATAGAAGSASITLSASATIAKDKVLYAAGGGADNAAVYCALFMGKDAFAVVDPEGEGQEMYIKDRSEIGGPIEQFSTVGYKFNHGAIILYPERLLRVETGSFYSDVDEEN